MSIDVHGARLRVPPRFTSGVFYLGGQYVAFFKHLTVPTASGSWEPGAGWRRTKRDRLEPRPRYVSMSSLFGSHENAEAAETKASENQKEKQKQKIFFNGGLTSSTPPAVSYVSYTYVADQTRLRRVLFTTAPLHY